MMFSFPALMCWAWSAPQVSFYSQVSAGPGSKSYFSGRNTSSGFQCTFQFSIHNWDLDQKPFQSSPLWTEWLLKITANHFCVVAVSDGCCYMVHCPSRALIVSKVQQPTHRFSEAKSPSSADLSEISGPVVMEPTRRHVQQGGNKKTSEQKEQPALWGRAWWVFLFRNSLRFRTR